MSQRPIKLSDVVEHSDGPAWTPSDVDPRNDFGGPQIAGPLNFASLGAPEACTGSLGVKVTISPYAIRIMLDELLSAKVDLANEVDGLISAAVNALDLAPFSIDVAPLVQRIVVLDAKIQALRWVFGEGTDIELVSGVKGRSK